MQQYVQEHVCYEQTYHDTRLKFHSYKKRFTTKWITVQCAVVNPFSSYLWNGTEAAQTISLMSCCKISRDMFTLHVNINSIEFSALIEQELTLQKRSSIGRLENLRVLVLNVMFGDSLIHEFSTVFCSTLCSAQQMTLHTSQMKLSWYRSHLTLLQYFCRRMLLI